MEKELEPLFLKHKLFISRVNTTIVREQMNRIHWEKPLVAIKGSRGVGKTTLIRQYIRQNYGVNAGDALYCVMDSIYFSNHSLLDLAGQFQMMGGKHLFLDEVHKYPDWSRELKEINDLYPDLKITFSGSSLIQILNADADLSRRVLSYDMPGLSFREFMRFYHNITLPVFPLDELLSNADEVCRQVLEVCKPIKLFKEYLSVGYYPFYDGDKEEYYSRIENVVQFIIDQEMTLYCGVEPAYTRKLKAMLLFLANNIPYQVNIAKLASYLELNKQTVLSYLASMQRAELLHLLYADNKSVTKMQKPDKIYLHNPNMLQALGTDWEIGTLRECFAINQLAVAHEVEYGRSAGDLLVDGKFRFEIGGEDKSFDQIADLPCSYVLADNIEFPIGNKLPLWMIGLLY